MFAELGTRLDEALYSWQVRGSVLRYRVGRRLGLIPPPTPDEIARAEAWRRAMEMIGRLAPSLPPFASPLAPPLPHGTTVQFPKYGELTLASESESEKEDTDHARVPSRPEGAERARR